MMATKRRMPKTLQVISIMVLLLNIINVNGVTDEEFTKLQSQMDTFAQRIVVLEQKNFEKQRVIARQQTIIEEQGDTIAEIKHDTTQQSHTVTELQTTVKQQLHTMAELETTVKQQSHTVTELQTTVKQQSHTVTELQTTVKQQSHTVTELQTTVKQQTRYIRQQSTQLWFIRKALHTTKKPKQAQNTMTTKPSDLEEVVETELSIPTPPLSNNRLHSPQTAFQKDQGNRKRFVNIEAGPVAFMARLSTFVLSHVGDNQNIPFDNVLLNLGNAYHKLHGVFIAPQSGIYLFSSSILSDHVNNVEVHAAIVQNGNTVAIMYAHGDSGRHDQGAQTVVIQVKQGDEIWVRNIDYADDQIVGLLFSTFSGYLLLPM